MIKNSPGFSIFELIMVMAVSSIIMSSLLIMYNQITHNMQRVEKMIRADMQILTTYQRLDKDYKGLTPIWFTQADRVALEEKKIKSANKENKELEPLSDQITSGQYFYSIQKHDNLELVSWITTTGLAWFPSTNNYYIRVVYAVIPDKYHPNHFCLMRKEMSPTDTINQENLSSGKFYQLADQIISITAEYTYLDLQELQRREKSQSQSSDTKNDNQTKQQPKPIIKKSKNWTDFVKITKPQTSTDQRQVQQESAHQETSQAVEPELRTVPDNVTVRIKFAQSGKTIEQVWYFDIPVSAIYDITYPDYANEKSTAEKPDLHTAEKAKVAS